MTEQFRNIKWVDLIINFLVIAVTVITPMTIGLINISKNQVVLVSKMDDALVRQKTLESNISKILTEQSTIRANLQNYTGRVERLEENTKIIGMLHQRIINNEGKISRLETEINNLRNEKLLRRLTDE